MTTSFGSKPTAAVLGGSIAGLMASLVLQKNDFAVTLYEREEEYIRSIQWTVRQSFINYLYSVDKTIGEHVYELVSPMTNGFRYMSDRTLKYPDGAYKHRSREHPCPGNGVAPRESCEKSLDVPAIGIIRARELEACLLEELGKKPNVTISLPCAPQCERSGEEYVLIADPEKPEEKTSYDLIVVCVGAGKSRDKLKFVVEGKSREEFPAKSNPLSRWRPQVSGEVKLKRRGMVTQYQHAKKDKNYLKNLRSGELLFSALLSTDELDTTCWVIGDVSTQFYNIVAGMPKGPEKDDLVEEECEKIAARTMLETKENVDDAGVSGVLDETVRMFVSQAKIASVAYAGNNLVLAGDAVGAAHWAVGGGMHVAGMCHQKRLDALARELRNGKERKAALKKYSNGALEDTKAWISRSMEYYYLSIPKDVVDDVFKDVMKDLKKNKSIDAPDEMKKRIISVYFGSKYDMDPEAAGFDATP